MRSTILVRNFRHLIALKSPSHAGLSMLCRDSIHLSKVTGRGTIDYRSKGETASHSPPWRRAASQGLPRRGARGHTAVCVNSRHDDVFDRALQHFGNLLARVRPDFLGHIAQIGIQQGRANHAVVQYDGADIQVLVFVLARGRILGIDWRSFSTLASITLCSWESRGRSIMRCSPKATGRR